MSDNLKQAIAAIKAGDNETGHQLLMKVIKADPANEAAWLWMASTLDDPQEKKECLQKVLQINPDNEMAKKALAAFERPREPAELPRLQDIAPKPAQEAAPSTDLAGSRLRLSLLVLGGVAVLLVLCIGAMLVLPSIVGREALVSMFSSSNPPGEQSLTGTAAPATEPGQTFEAYPPTWTPATPDTPSPTQTPMPTLAPSLTFTPRPTPTPGPPIATPIPAHDARNETQTIGPIWDELHDESFSMEITLKDVEWSTGSQYDKPRSGRVYVITHVRIKNHGPDSSRSVSPIDFQVLDANGALYDNDYISAARDCGLDFIDLIVGGSIEGCVCFEVPTSGKVDLIYAPYMYEGLEPGRYLSFNLRP